MTTDRKDRIPASYAADRAERVNINLITGCWVWAGAYAGPDRPVTHEGSGQSARRSFYNTAYQADVRSGTPFISFCGTAGCIHPAHRKPGPRRSR